MAANIPTNDITTDLKDLPIQVENKDVLLKPDIREATDKGELNVTNPFDVAKALSLAMDPDKKPEDKKEEPKPEVKPADTKAPDKKDETIDPASLEVEKQIDELVKGGMTLEDAVKQVANIDTTTFKDEVNKVDDDFGSILDTPHAQQYLVLDQQQINDIVRLANQPNENDLLIYLKHNPTFAATYGIEASSLTELPTFEDKTTNALIRTTISKMVMDAYKPHLNNLNYYHGQLQQLSKIQNEMNVAMNQELVEKFPLMKDNNNPYLKELTFKTWSELYLKEINALTKVQQNSPKRVLACYEKATKAYESVYKHQVEKYKYVPKKEANTVDQQVKIQQQQGLIAGQPATGMNDNGIKLNDPGNPVEVGKVLGQLFKKG